MQFTKMSAFATLALATLAAATPTRRNDSPSNQCNTGSLQCCNSLQSANSASLAGLLGLLGVVVGTITGQVGVTCSPITGVGVSGTSCSEQPVCCTNNAFNGVIALGCSPININL
uniref:Class I hydrophobin 1 n=1 Tax=Pholiota microspora TaxID=1538424 RepID=PNH1_PHOMI|nr:hydrophobin-251 [Pholiota nameko]